MERLLCLVIGYAFGLIQTSYIIGKIKGIDIRDYGSGNAGTTNAMRVLGKKAGFLTFAVDAAKCVVAVIITWNLFIGCEYDTMLKFYTTAGVILGHDFPFYLKFHGGKGIAASVGMILAFADIRLMVIAALAFCIPYFITHYVSLGSLCLSLSFLVGIIISGQMGCYPLSQRYLTEMYILVAVLTAIAFIQHRANIKRLATGTERKMGVKKK